MPLPYPLSKGIYIYYRTGKHFKCNTPILSCYNSAQVFAKELIRIENTQKCTPIFIRDIFGNVDLTNNQRSVIYYNIKIKSGITLFQN